MTENKLNKFKSFRNNLKLTQFYFPIFLFSMILIPEFSWARQNETIQNNLLYNETNSIVELNRLAIKGDSDAQYLLGVIYLTGEGLRKDEKLAKKWLQKSANQGDIRAQNLMGVMLDPIWFGRKNNTVDLTEAALWYRRAAIQGSNNAFENLKLMKKNRLLKDDLTPQMLLQRNGLLNKNKKDSEKKDSREIFQSIAPTIVEVMGPDNYGSGVIIGSYDTKNDSGSLSLVGENIPFEIPFVSQTTQNSSLLNGPHIIVITNQHVLEGSNKIILGIGSNREGETQGRIELDAACFPKSKGSTLDLALLFISMNSKASLYDPHIRVANLYRESQKIDRGTMIYAVGNPEKLERTITQGLYNGIREEGIQFDAPISHGSSGGALVDDSGRLIGITTGFSTNKESQNLNFAIPYFEISKFLHTKDLDCIAH